MCLTVDLELTREVRERLEEDEKIVVYKRPLLVPSVEPERRSIRSQMCRSFVWREGWNRAAGDTGIRRGALLAPRIAKWLKISDEGASLPPLRAWPEVHEGQILGPGVLHAWLHKHDESDPYLMALEGRAEDFVAAGVYPDRHVHVAFTGLYLPMAEYKRVAKLEVPPTPEPDITAMSNAAAALTPAQPPAQQLGRLPQLGSADAFGSILGGAI